MDGDKLDLFVKNLVDINKKEELDVLWSFVFSGCKTGFKKFTNEAKEHFAKIFKKSLEMKYNESDYFRIIDNITKPMEIELGGLDVSNIDNDRVIVVQALLSNKADKILIGEFKEKIKNLEGYDKEILDLILAFVYDNKSDTLSFDKFYVQSLDCIEYIEVKMNIVREFLRKFKNIDKTDTELIHIFVSNGFILSPYVASSSPSLSENIVVPLFLLDVYVNDFLQSNLISEIKNWEEKGEEKIETIEKEQKIGYSSWTKKPREKEEREKQTKDKLNSYISELMKYKDFISIDIISTLAYTPTAKSYVDINGKKRDKAEEFRGWLWKLAVENIKIKHNLKEKEAKEKVNKEFDRFFDIFPDFLSYEYYDDNISALYRILKNLLEINKENEIKNRLGSSNEKEKIAVSFLIEYIKSELTEFLDRGTVSLEITTNLYHSKFDLAKCNQVINHIFEENYGINASFKRHFPTFTPFGGTQIKIEKYPRFEIGDIAVKSGFGFWSPRITGSSTTGFGIVLTFPTWLLTKSWENLPKIHDFEQKIIKVKTEEKSQKFSDSIEKELKIDLDEFGPFEFENFISQLFGEMGYEVWPTRKTGDYGIDVIAKKDGIKIGIQCKKNSPENLVGAQDVQKTLGSRFKHNVDKCILITTSDFTAQAREQARNAPIELWNRSTLEENIMKYLLTL